MKPEAYLEVANKSRAQAELYFQKGNLGRAFAHFLVALKLCSSWKGELCQQFVSALCSWGDELDKQKRYKDLYNCYEQALEVFPDNEEVLHSLGFHLYRSGHLIQACSYFRKAVACNPGFLSSRRNLHACSLLLVERWHYRMLNDSVRNDAYRAAITRKVLQLGAGTSVLDIGTGTGLLSLFAVEAGAERVFACDYSTGMIEIASQVLEANGAGHKVSLINKLSNNIVIPRDMPTRVSLVVTETVDAGLLGEGILESLIHAWQHLLIPSDVATVVPQAATVWMAPIECLHIARKYRFLNEDEIERDTNIERDDFNLSKLRLIATRRAPYDTEDLNMVPGGYRFLAKPSKALNIKFNDCKDMHERLIGEKETDLWFECTEPGRIDAMVAWFDLELDDMITLSSTPVSGCADYFHKANCWDQAVFPFQHLFHFKSNDKLKINVTCRGGKISVYVLDYKPNDVMKNLEEALYNSSISSSDVSTVTYMEEDEIEGEVMSDKDNREIKMKTEMMQSNEPILCRSELHFDKALNTLFLTKEAVKFLNDVCWMEALETTAKYLCQEVKHNGICSVLDLCPFPVLGLHLLKKRNANVTCVSVSLTENVIKMLSELNGFSADKIHRVDINYLKEYLQQSKSLFDVILIHPVYVIGELREDMFRKMPLLRSSLADGGIILPRQISLRGQLLESDWLRHVSKVRDNSHTCGFNIASFVNIFQVPQHLDVNLSTLGAACLSSPSELLRIILDTDTGDITKTVAVQATYSGKANALGYWYDILIHEAAPSVSTLHQYSHASQSAVLFDPSIAVSKQHDVNLRIRFQHGLVYVDYLHNEENT